MAKEKETKKEIEKESEENITEEKEDDEIVEKAETEEKSEETKKEKTYEKSKTGKTTEFDKETWKPKTSVGRDVKEGTIKEIDEILDKGIKILEPEIVDMLLPNLETDLLLVGQSKGKFGGGQRRVFRQTQKKTREGNKPRFATVVVAGNNDGYVGIGYGKSKETVPAREKAIRKSKLNMMKIRRGCGSWECNCGEPHSVPFSVEGKCGSVLLKLMPAPKGTGLCAEGEISKILKMAGITDVWSKTKGQTKTKMNLIAACQKALRKMTQVKIKSREIEKLSVIEGRLGKVEENAETA